MHTVYNIFYFFQFCILFKKGDEKYGESQSKKKKMRLWDAQPMDGRPNTSGYSSCCAAVLCQKLLARQTALMWTLAIEPKSAEKREMQNT